MKTKLLYALWGFCYVVCYALSHISRPTPAQAPALTVIGLVFFLPGLLLLTDAQRRGSRKGILAIRWISLGSLVLTVAAFIANIASVNGSPTLGNILNEVFLLVSVPLTTVQIAVVSLFLWACLLFGSFAKPKK